MGKQLIDRTLASSISDTFRILPVVTLTGPRQSGKTTLCREWDSGLPFRHHHRTADGCASVTWFAV